MVAAEQVTLHKTRILDASMREKAFRELIAEETESLLRLAGQLMRDGDEARDLVQDALLRAFLSLDGFRWDCSLKRWVTRILVNLGLKRLRRRKLVSRVASWLRPSGEDAPASLPWGPRPAATPEQEASLHQQAEVLRQAVERLPPQQKIALLLRYLEEMSVQEIAEVMKIGPGTVKTHLVRAVRQLRATGGASAARLEVKGETL